MGGLGGACRTGPAAATWRSSAANATKHRLAPIFFPRVNADAYGRRDHMVQVGKYKPALLTPRRAPRSVGQEACARRAPSASPAAHGCCCRVRRRRRQRRASTVTFSPATASTRDVRACGAMMCHCRYDIHGCCAPIPIMPCPSVRNTSDARSPERLHRHILRFVICAVLLELLRFRRAALRALRPRQGWHAMQP